MLFRAAHTTSHEQVLFNSQFKKGSISFSADDRT